MSDTQLVPDRYFELIDHDTERLLAMGERDLTAQVPCCPGWDVRDVLAHTAEVYEHKVRMMADNGWPSPWPPADFADRDPLDFLRQAKADLFEEFARHQPDEQTTTFSPDDTTITFWMRRMALEVAIHRYDAELAHGEMSPVPDDLALDGIDEMLRVMLEVDESEDVPTDHPVEAMVAVEAAGRRWLCDLRERSVTITTDSANPAAATVGGDPAVVFLWLWGRVGDERVERSGDSNVLNGFRGRLVECSQ